MGRVQEYQGMAALLYTLSTCNEQRTEKDALLPVVIIVHLTLSDSLNHNFNFHIQELLYVHSFSTELADLRNS